VVLVTQEKNRSCTECKYCELIEAQDGLKVKCKKASARKTLADFNLYTFKKLNSKACLHFAE